MVLRTEGAHGPVSRSRQERVTPMPGPPNQSLAILLLLPPPHARPILVVAPKAAAAATDCFGIPRMGMLPGHRLQGWGVIPAPLLPWHLAWVPPLVHPPVMLLGSAAQPWG